MEKISEEEFVKIREKIQKQGFINLSVKVICNAKKAEITEILENESGVFLKLKIKSIPEKGRANKEIVKFFREKFAMKCEIINGLKSNIKVIKLFI